MGRFIIRGARQLSGEINVSGSKNAALPIIFSTITIRGITTLHNVPCISDVDVALEILSSLGAKISRYECDVILDTRELEYKVPEEYLVSKIRASSYLIGATLARFGLAKIQSFGGCNFDSRPIDMHIDTALSLGASLNDNIISASHLNGADIIFNKISVGATVNALIMAASARGISHIFGYAKEPHVISLIDFLRTAGADITFDEKCITVIGAELSSAEAYIIPDMIEAGTYISLSIMMGSELKIFGAERAQLESFIEPLSASGISFVCDKNSIVPSGRVLKPLNIITAPYPAFPTDLQPQCAPLLALGCGGVIREGVWHNRFGYLSELSKFGIKSEIHDGYAKILKSNITPSNAVAPDLRGGAALMLCALYANGDSEIDGAEIINRGYADIAKKLRAVGASIEEI